MKFSVVSTLLFGSLASAVVLPPYQFEKRDTATDEVLVTVTSTTTIYLDPTAASAFFASQSSALLAAEEASSTTATTPTSVPPPPTTTPTVAAANTPLIEAAASPPTSAAPPNTYTPPAYTPPAPTPTPPASAAGAALQVPAAAGGEASGTGDITYYEVGVAATSCGTWHSDGEPVVALPISVMSQFNPGNPNNNPLCGKTVTITYEGKSFSGTVFDTCGGCDSQSIDLSPSLFQTVTGDMGLGRVKGVSWSVA